jgi:hypothetical protein
MKRLLSLLIFASLVGALAPVAVQAAKPPDDARSSGAKNVLPVQEKWYVQFKKASDKRWTVYGPYSYYDACNKKSDLELKGYTAYVTKNP